MKKSSKKPKFKHSNSTPAFINNIIDKSPYKEAMEMFILGALITYSEHILETDKALLTEKGINAENWQGCAKEVLAKMDARYRI